MYGFVGLTPMEVIVILVVLMLFFGKGLPPRRRPPTGAVPVEPERR